MLTLLLVAGALLGVDRPEAPVVVEQPLAKPSFVLFHTNDTRGYLESCG